MKKIVLMTLLMVPALLFAQGNGPAASPAASASTKVGMTDVTIDYFRPKMKGRKIFGAGDVLVPYGKIWRTGANGGTKVTFSTDVTIAGKTVPKGEYLIFTWPGASEWEVSFYKDVTIGGYTDKYDNANEVLKTKVKSIALNNSVEALTANISDLSEDSTKAAIEISWEKTAIKIPFSVPKSW